MHRRLIATIVAASLTLIAVAGVAIAAGKPKRGTYIDTKLQVYITTTKDVSAVKSFQAPCLGKSSTGELVQSGSMVVSRRMKIKPGGAFSYSGKAKIYSGSAPKPAIETVKVKASYTGGKYKGTASFPAKYECETTAFSAKYYGVNPQG